MGKPTEAKTQLRKCPRCNFKIKSNNQNPHGLCGYCQTELGKGERLTKWIADGKPQEKQYRKHRRAKPPVQTGTAHELLKEWSSEALMQELEFRKSEAKALLKFLGS